MTVATSTAHHLVAKSLRIMVEYDENGSDNFVDLGTPQGAALKCRAINGYRRFIVGVLKTVTGTPGGMTTVTIGGATAADGTGYVACVSKAATTANLLGDTVWLECDIEQIRESLATATFVGVKIDNEQADNEQAIYFEMADPTHEYQDLTADFIG